MGGEQNKKFQSIPRKEEYATEYPVQQMKINPYRRASLWNFTIQNQEVLINFQGVAGEAENIS